MATLLDTIRYNLAANRSGRRARETAAGVGYGGRALDPKQLMEAGNLNRLERYGGGAGTSGVPEGTAFGRTNDAARLISGIGTGDERRTTRSLLTEPDAVPDGAEVTRVVTGEGPDGSTIRETIRFPYRVNTLDEARRRALVQQGPGALYTGTGETPAELHGRNMVQIQTNRFASGAMSPGDARRFANLTPREMIEGRREEAVSDRALRRDIASTEAGAVTGAAEAAARGQVGAAQAGAAGQVGAAFFNARGEADAARAGRTEPPAWLNLGGGSAMNTQTGQRSDAPPPASAVQPPQFQTDPESGARIMIFDGKATQVRTDKPDSNVVMALTLSQNQQALQDYLDGFGPGSRQPAAPGAPARPAASAEPATLAEAKAAAVAAGQTEFTFQGKRYRIK